MGFVRLHSTHWKCKTACCCLTLSFGGGFDVAMTVNKVEDVSVTEDTGEQKRDRRYKRAQV